MGPGVARWSLALPDVRGVAGRPLVSPCGVAVCTLVLLGGRGVAGWLGALPDNGLPPIPNLDPGSGIRVLGQGRSYNVTCLFKFRDVSISTTKGHKTVSVKNTNSVTLSQPQIRKLRVAFSQTWADRGQPSCCAPVPCPSLTASPFCIVVSDVPRGSSGPRG